MRLSIVVPAFREEERLPATVRRMLAHLDATNDDAEIIIVDDGSPDRTSEVARALAAADRRVRPLALPVNRGKGAAVRAGVLAARGERVLFSDADLSTPIEELAKLDAALDAGSDVAIGSRATPGARVEVRQGLLRSVMGVGFRNLVRLIAVRGFDDTQCGFKLFTRPAARFVFAEMTIERFGFNVEILFLAVAAGLRVREVPVVWRNDERTTVSPVRDATRMFLDLGRIRWRHRGRGAALRATAGSSGGDGAPDGDPGRRA